MSGFHLKMIDAADVPTPGVGEAFLFIGLDGRARGKLAGGVVVDVLQGLPGEKGEQGVAGAQGAKGDKGDAGVAGAQGEQGVAGAQGAKGDKGDAGVAGAQGEQGVAGSQGAKGDKGDAGVAGAQGEQGVAGAQGAKGDKGDAGADGAAGENGLKGDKGQKGDAGVFDSVIELASIGAARAGSSSLLIAARPAVAGVSLAGRMVRVRAMVDTSANSNIVFSLNCGGLVFTFPAIAVSGSRRNIFEASALTGVSASASNAYCSQASASLTGTASDVLGSAVVSGSLTGESVLLNLSSAGQTCTTRLAQIEVI